MTELETLSARLEAAVKRQTEADEAYHKAAEEVESIKAAMVELKANTKSEQIAEFREEARKAEEKLQELYDRAFGENKAKIIVHIGVKSLFCPSIVEYHTI